MASVPVDDELASTGFEQYDYLAIGNPTLDHDGAGEIHEGGSSLYAGCQAAALGMTTCVYGTCSDSDRRRFSRALHNTGVTLRLVRADETTTFRNEFSGKYRTQHVLHTGGLIPLPPAATARICNVCPVVHELRLERGWWTWLKRFDLVCCTPQGAIREWNDQGRVQLRPMALHRDFWEHVDVLVVNDEEEAYVLQPIELVLGNNGAVAVTLGPAGARLRHGSDDFIVPGLRLPDAVDPNGAGDCFAAAISIGLFKGMGLREAARFAVVASGLSVRQRGLAGISSDDKVAHYLHPNRAQDVD